MKNRFQNLLSKCNLCRYPVDPETMGCPDYFDVVKQPMGREGVVRVQGSGFRV